MLRRHAPSLRVCLLEATGYGGVRIGETLPPPAASVLQHLGVWDAFRAQEHHPAYATAAAWGASVPYEHDFVFGVHSVGWHLDRRRFDTMLSAQASAAGVDARTETRVVDARRDGERWILRLSSGDQAAARMVVDATGGQAWFARRFGGARSVVADRLAGFLRFHRQPSSPDPRTLVEAFEAGWWYTSPLPGGGRVTGCMTDTDLAREMRLEDGDVWDALLARSAPHVVRAMAGCVADGPPVVRAARSRHLSSVTGDGWVAVGDAASAFDPLSSQGVLKALRSGIFAAYAVGDVLVKGDDAGLRRYEHYVAREFAAYQQTKARYYAEERRWPESAFWRRRMEPAMAPA
jgi:2-polyprenyl-6-methoxyphenol hydroxylase-like FAD-dependent oxidoreductase